MRPCSGGGKHRPQSPPITPFTVPLQWVGKPASVQLTFGAHGRHPPCRLVVKPRKGLLQPRGQYPCIVPKQEHRFYHCHIEPRRCSLIHSLPSQDLHQPSPFSPCPPEVLFHCRPIVISGRQHSSQLPEQRYRCQRCTIRQEYPPHLLLRILNQQSPLLPLRPALSHC